MLGTKTKKKIAIIACEPSGDKIAANLLKSLGNLLDFEAIGVGGANMIQEGFKSIFNMQDLSVMGFTEILLHIPKIAWRMSQLVKWIKNYNPDILITVDAPGFNARVIQKLRRCNVKFPIVQYVAPTVWAYGAERAEHFAKLYDHILTILPFEKEYFDKVGLPCTYVGHPVLESTLSKNNKSEIKKNYGFEKSEILLALLPGSRRQEINYHMPILVQLIDKLVAKYGQQIKFFIPTFDHLLDLCNEHLAHSKFKTQIIVSIDERIKKDMMFISDAACVKSGTVAIDMAMMRVPMVIFYKISRISAFIIQKKIKIKYISILNFMADKMIIPELIQDDCNAVNMFEEISNLLDNSGHDQLNELHSIIRSVGRDHQARPSEIAAEVIISNIK